jgi:hypothetical protein
VNRIWQHAVIAKRQKVKSLSTHHLEVSHLLAYFSLFFPTVDVTQNGRRKSRPRLARARNDTMMQCTVAQHSAVRTQRRCAAQRSCQPACATGNVCEREGGRLFSHRCGLCVLVCANRRLPRTRSAYMLSLAVFGQACFLISGRSRASMPVGRERRVSASESYCCCS